MAHTPETRARALEKMKERRQSWFLANGPCRVCGSWSDLEVDHIDPTLKVSHNVWSWSEEKRNAELAKCQVLCKTHHKEKTRKESVTTEHGTYAMRNTHQCKCDLCMEYVRNQKRQSRLSLGRN